MCHSASQVFELFIHTKAQRNRTQCVMLSCVVCCLPWCRWETRLAAGANHTLDLMVGFVPFVELFCVNCVKQPLFLHLSIGLNKPPKFVELSCECKNVMTKKVSFYLFTTSDIGDEVYRVLRLLLEHKTVY